MHPLGAESVLTRGIDRECRPLSSRAMTSLARARPAKGVGRTG
jgi:hypothetical protein